MRYPSQRRAGFVDPSTIVMIALLAVGAISLATTSRAVESAVSTDAATNAATEVTAPAPVPLPAESASTVTAVPAPLPAETTPAAPAPEPPAADAPKEPAPSASPTATPEVAPIDDKFEQPPNPQECRDVRRQIRDQFRELNRFEKMLRKMKLDADLQTLIALRAKLKGFDNAIAQGCTRERLQDFWDEEAWEHVNEFRCKVELPKQFVQIERELKRLERSATAKKLTVARLDAARFKANLEEVRQALTTAKGAVASGSCEDANDAMQTIYEGKHPGEINGVVQRLYELGSQLKRVKDAAVREEFAVVLQPVIDAADEGDFREANQALNDVFNELQQLLYRVISSRRYKYSPKLEKLESLLMEKFEKFDREGGSSAPAPTTPAQ